jgi:hypothetical protein
MESIRVHPEADAAFVETGESRHGSICARAKKQCRLVGHERGSAVLAGVPKTPWPGDQTESCNAMLQSCCFPEYGSIFWPELGPTEAWGIAVSKEALTLKTHRHP